MDKKFFKYLESISIVHKNGTYDVFTVLTQHFFVKSLDELTIERFEKAEEDLKRREELQSASMIPKSRRSFFKE